MIFEKKTDYETLFQIAQFYVLSIPHILQCEHYSTENIYNIHTYISLSLSYAYTHSIR